MANLLVFNRLQALPTRNFQAGQLEGVEQLAGSDLGPARRVARNSCASCTIGCEHVYALNEPHPPGAESGVRMEYESLFALGSLCGVNDPDAVLRAAALCDHYGLDTISTGGTIAFLMECTENGWMEGRLPVTGRLLQFGDPAALLEAVEALAGRRGELGATARVGKSPGGRTDRRRRPRIRSPCQGAGAAGLSPGTAANHGSGPGRGTRGADHNRSGAYEADFSEHNIGNSNAATLAQAAAATEDRSAVLDSLILCKFLRGALDDLYADAASMLAAVTGWEFTSAELHGVAQRVVTARKCLNIREGWTRAEDTLPGRLFDSASPRTGQQPLTHARLETHVDAYYQVRGWTAAGLVPDALRAELGLGPAFGEARR